MTGKDAKSPQTQHYPSSHCSYFMYLQQDQKLGCRLAFRKQSICSRCVRKINLSFPHTNTKRKIKLKVNMWKESICFLIVRRIVRLLRIKDVNGYRSSKQHAIQKFKWDQRYIGRWGKSLEVSQNLKWFKGITLNLFSTAIPLKQEKIRQRVVNKVQPEFFSTGSNK